MMIVLIVLLVVYSKITLKTKLQNPLCNIISISKDSKKLIVGHTVGGNITLWDTESSYSVDYQVMNEEYGQEDIVIGENVFVTASYDGNYDHYRIGVYNRSNGEFIYEIDEKAYSVDISPDGKMLASGGGGKYGDVKLWDIGSGRCLSILKGHTAFVEDVTFSPDGKLLASSSFDRTVKIWDVQKEECLFSLKERHMPWSISFSSDGKLLASGSNDFTISIWDVSTGELKNTLKGHADLVHSVDFSPKHNSLLASGDFDGIIKLWDIDKGECIYTNNPIERVITDLQFFPNGNYLASVHAVDEVVNIWENQDGLF